MRTFFGRNWQIIALSTFLMVGILATTVIGRANPTRQQVDMRSYVGKYNFDLVDGYILLENPMVLDAFTQANVPESVGRDIRGYEVSGPIEDQQGILISQGCLQHFCSEFHYKLYVNLEYNSVALCHFARQATWYVSQGVASAPSTAPCPSEFSSAPSSIRAALGQGNIPTTAATATQQSSYAANIVGGWVPSGESCEGDGGIIYLADGTWSALSADGTWTVRQNLLAMRTLHQGEPGEGMQTLRPPRIDINTIVNLTGSSMTQRFGDGSTVSFTKC